MNVSFSSCFVDILAHPQEADESVFHQVRSTKLECSQSKMKDNRQGVDFNLVVVLVAITVARKRNGPLQKKKK